VAYELADYNATEQTLHFTKVSQLEAGVPYVIHVPEQVFSYDEAFSFSTTEITATTAATVSKGDISFVGTYASIADMTGNWGVTNTARIAVGGSGSSMKGFRAYFTGIPTTATGAPALRLAFDDMATGIETILLDLAGDDRVYDLNGQRVMQPKKGNVYIVNGKKQIWK